MSSNDLRSVLRMVSEREPPRRRRAMRRATMPYAPADEADGVPAWDHGRVIGWLKACHDKVCAVRARRSRAAAVACYAVCVPA